MRQLQAQPPLPGDELRKTSLGSLSGGLIPIQNLLTVPVHHARVFGHVLVDLFEIFDAERLSRNIGVNRDGHHTRAV